MMLVGWWGGNSGLGGDVECLLDCAPMTREEWTREVMRPLQDLWQTTLREIWWPEDAQAILRAVSSGDLSPAEGGDQLWHWLLWPPDEAWEPLISAALADWLCADPGTTGASPTGTGGSPTTSGICPTAALPWVANRLGCAWHLAVCLAEIPWVIDRLPLSDAPQIRLDLATRHWAQQGPQWGLELACDAAERRDQE